jgi:hypothetical protein
MELWFAKIQREFRPECPEPRELSFFLIKPRALLGNKWVPGRVLQ